MALPEPFSDVEHWQRVVRREYNDEIRQHFKDKFGGSDTWEAEIRTTRGQMLQALLHQDSDPVQLTLGRMKLYDFVFTRHQQSPTFIDMTDRPFEAFTYRPEVTLYFYKSTTTKEKKIVRDRGFISYRLVGESSETITPAKNRVRAERIKDLFATPNRFIWHKGKLKFTYQDYKNGYFFRVLATTKAEAKRLIEQVLDIERKVPDWDRLSTGTPERQSTKTRQTQRIYGKEREVPRWRPTVDVPFLRATISIHGIPYQVPLLECISGVPIISVKD